MKRFLNWFRHVPNNSPSSANRPRSFRPQLEQLESRLVPSTLSSAISIQHPSGGLSWTERDWYATDLNTGIGTRTGQVVQFRGASRRNLGGPNDVSEVSASVDPNTGSAEVFVLDGKLSLWLCDSSGTWHSFGGWYCGIAATRDGHVYAESDADSHMYYLDSKGASTDLGAPKLGLFIGSVGSAGNGSLVAASVGWFGSNEVFALGSDSAIYVYNSVSAPGQWQLVDNSQQFISLSATVNNTVFAMTKDWKLYQETEHFRTSLWTGFSFYWSGQDISAGTQWRGISADTDALGRDEVYAIAGSSAYLYDQGCWTLKDTDVVNINGADGGYFYDVNGANDRFLAWLYIPGASGSPWIYLDSGIW